MTYSEIEGLADLYEIPLDEQMVRWARAVAAAEREACAKVCEVHGSMAKHAVWMAEECAALIRARGNDE